VIVQHPTWHGGESNTMFLESITNQQFIDLGQKRQLEILAEHCTGI